jgi:hypothetical protein
LNKKQHPNKKQKTSNPVLHPESSKMNKDDTHAVEDGKIREGSGAAQANVVEGTFTLLDCLFAAFCR